MSYSILGMNSKVEEALESTTTAKVSNIFEDPNNELGSAIIDLFKEVTDEKANLNARVIAQLKDVGSYIYKEKAEESLEELLMICKDLYDLFSEIFEKLPNMEQKNYLLVWQALHNMKQINKNIIKKLSEFADVEFDQLSSEKRLLKGLISTLLFLSENAELKKYSLSS